MTSRRTLATVVLAAAIAAAGCTEGAELGDEPIDEADDVAADEGGPADEPEADVGDADRPTGVAEVIDDECFGETDRCGMILRRVGDGSDDLVAVHFSVTGAERDERPLLVLRSPGTTSALEAAFVDRPVVVVETRGGWRSPPEVDCPEARITSSNDDAVTAWATCRARIAAGGFDVAHTDLASIASDVLAVADTLELDEVDLLASRFGSPVALYTATLAPELVGRVVLHRPIDPTHNAIAQRHTSVEAALRAVWDACTADAGCDTALDLDPFLDLVAALDDAPIELPPRSPEIDDEVVSIDAPLLMRLLEYQLGSAAGARTVVEVPGWLTARSVDQLGRLYDDVPPTDSSAVDLSWVCSTLDQPYDRPAHPLFTDLIERSLTRIVGICDAWTTDAADAVSYDPAAAEVLTVVSAGDAASAGELADSASFGELLVIPSLGVPPTACVVAAAEAWVRDGSVTDDPACTRPPDFRPPDASIELVDAEYAADWFPGEVTLVAPAGWGDGAFGYWARDRDTFDRTSLEVWLHEDTTVEELQTWLPDAAEIVVDGPAELRVTDHAKWQVVRATSTWDDGERVVIGTGSFGDAVVEVVVRGAASEIDELTSTVFDPVLESVRYPG